VYWKRWEKLKLIFRSKKYVKISLLSQINVLPHGCVCVVKNIVAVAYFIANVLPAVYALRCHFVSISCVMFLLGCIRQLEKMIECTKSLCVSSHFTMSSQVVSTSVRRGDPLCHAPPSDPKNKKMYKQYSAVV